MYEKLKQEYMQKYNDPTFFNHEYQKYKAHLAGPAEETDAASDNSVPHTAVTRASSEVSEDRNQEDVGTLEQAASDVAPQI